MNVTLTPDLEQALVQRARQHGTTPEAVVLDAIREKLGPEPAELAKILEPRDEWEERLLRVGTPCGVSVSDEALSSEGLYD
jgi:hypothetical protein